VLVEVRMTNVAEPEPFDGTDTNGSDHHAVAPGMCDQFRAAGTTAPSKPDTLVNVTVYLAVCPFVTVTLLALTAPLKFPSPIYEMVVEAPVAWSCRTSWKVPSCWSTNGPSVYLPSLSALTEKMWIVPSGKVEVSLTVAPALAVPVMLILVTPTVGLAGESAAVIPALFKARLTIPVGVGTNPSTTNKSRMLVTIINLTNPKTS
jgi:hypothetical protein